MKVNKSSVSDKDKLILAVIKECMPDLYETCAVISEPLLTDIKLVPIVREQIEISEGVTTYENIHIAIAVLDRLFIPTQLISNTVIRKPNGLRTAYCKLFNYEKPENINAWVSIMRPHYKNPRFAERIDDIAFRVYEFLKTNGHIMEDNQLKAPSPHPFEKLKKDGFLAKMIENRASGIKTHLDGVENALLF